MTVEKRDEIRIANLRKNQKTKRGNEQTDRKIKKQLNKAFQQQLATQKQEIEDRHYAENLQTQQLLAGYAEITSDLLDDNSRLNNLLEQLQQSLKSKDEDFKQLLRKYQDIVELQNDALWEGDEYVLVEMIKGMIKGMMELL